MMGVYINGMKIPKNCWECSLSDVDDDYGRCCLFSGIACLNIGRQDNCPLVEVPTPHGDLVDRDALMTEVMDSDFDHLQRDDWKEVIQIVADAPTIIEAEGSDT